MCAKIKEEAQNPLILRCHRLIEAFAKSDDERDFYIDRLEGFIIYVDLDKSQEDLDALEKELEENKERYCMIPKLSFYETKKIMEGFVNEKVYDIDTKEKLLDIIQSKEARENFLEFIYDHHGEQEKWQQFYLERSRIRLIEWLRLNHFHFVFEEDLDFPRSLLEKLKHALFSSKVSKDILSARKTLVMKAKTYYSNEALNPRPKRGRPPKQAVKAEIEPQITIDVFTKVPSSVRPFLFIPETNATPSFSMFSSKFGEGDLILGTPHLEGLDSEASLVKKLSSLRALSENWVGSGASGEKNPYVMGEGFDEEEEEEEEEDFDLSTKKPAKKKAVKSSAATSKQKLKKSSASSKEKGSTEKVKPKRIMPTAKKAAPSLTKLKKIIPKKP